MNKKKIKDISNEICIISHQNVNMYSYNKRMHVMTFENEIERKGYYVLTGGSKTFFDLKIKYRVNKFNHIYWLKLMYYSQETKEYVYFGDGLEFKASPIHPPICRPQDSYIETLYYLLPDISTYLLRVYSDEI